MHNDIIPQDGQDVAACVGTYLVLLHLVTYFFAFFFSLCPSGFMLTSY